MDNLNQYNLDHLRNLAIGTVDYVSPNEIKVALDTSAPQNTAINTGSPTLFPRINGFVLIPNETGALVGMISWLAVEHSQFPKRKGYKDFDLIDLPFPLRKMSINPMGTLKQFGKLGETKYKLERGIYNFPSIGDSVILPTDEQLRSIVENAEEGACIKIGNAPMAANAEVRINPDKLFGRHVAILGNTGSGKSCSVAGLIRWSLEEAAKELKDKQRLNTRFVILDPNGEYTNAFDGLNCNIKRFKVEVSEGEAAELLKVPAWLWNSYEWASFTEASGKTQRPILKQALREMRSNTVAPSKFSLVRVKRFVLTCLLNLQTDLNTGVAAFATFPGHTNFGKKLMTFSDGLRYFASEIPDIEPIKEELNKVADGIEQIANSKYNPRERNGETIVNYDPFSARHVGNLIKGFNDLILKFGEETFIGNTEDSPIPFEVNKLPEYIEGLAELEGKLQFVDFLTMRIRTMLADNRMKSIIIETKDVTLHGWLESTMNGLSIIDLSLVPSDIVHLIVSVISRVTFEALQRYRKLKSQLLPTVIVMEEAHNFIKRYNDGGEEVTSSKLCAQAFEKIAKEGRKFGLSLALSSQRPSELSPTVLSQCNTFLLHRIVNDKDQELVKRLVPDNIGGLLKELPILPTKKAILLGWATPIPILVEMNDLKKEHRPNSNDPDFWDVWTRKSERNIDWKELANDWQNID